MNDFNSKLYYQETLDLTRELCKIPAPSGKEDKRAEFILKYLKDIGYNNAYIDSAKNVIWSIDGQTEDCTLFMAHTDTVFPDLTELPIIEDEVYLSRILYIFLLALQSKLCYNEKAVYRILYQQVRICG